MIWSKKHRLFRERLAPTLKSHLALRTTGYRGAYEERGRTWIEYDGEEILSFCDFVHENRWSELGRDLDAVAKDGVFSKSDLGRALGLFLQMGVEEALDSQDRIILALAMVDRKVGKRRLLKLAETIEVEPVKTLLNLRMRAEQLRKAVQVTTGQPATTLRVGD
jgi:hypothetical protein